MAAKKRKQNEFYMKRVAGGYIRVPTHRGLGKDYSHSYDVAYRRKYKARRRQLAHRRNPAFSTPLVVAIVVGGYLWWRSRQPTT